MLSDTIHLFIGGREPYSTVNSIHTTNFYLGFVARIFLDFIEPRESRLHPTRRGCRKQVENVARIEVSIFPFFVVPRRKRNADK